MEINKCVKKSFVVIGKEGSTEDGEGFIARLWEDANSHFQEIAHLVKRDKEGNIGGVWRRASPKGCTWPGPNVRMGLRPLTAGQNG